MDEHGALTGTPGLRRLVGYSLVAGLSNLIPVPFLDDWVRDLLRQRQAMELARGHGLALTGAEGKALACGHHPPSARGCLRGCLVALVVQPARFLFKVVFKKILRKVLFFLTIKDVIDTFSRTLHEGYLLRHALELGVLSPSRPAQPAAGEVATGPPRPQVLALRRAIEATCDEVDPRPIEKAAAVSLRGSRRLLRRAGRAMSRRLQRSGVPAFRRAARHPDEQAVYERLERRGEEELGGLIDELTAGLAGQASYLEGLAKRLERRLAATAAATP